MQGERMPLAGLNPKSHDSPTEQHLQLEATAHDVDYPVGTTERLYKGEYGGVQYQFQHQLHEHCPAACPNISNLGEVSCAASETCIKVSLGTSLAVAVTLAVVLSVFSAQQQQGTAGLELRFLVVSC